MRTNFEVQTTYNREAIQAMTRMACDLFHPQLSGRIYLISFVMLLVGSLGASSENPFFMVMLALGCFVLTSAEYASKTAAKQIIASMKEEFPLMKFSFRSADIFVVTPKESGVVHYDILTRLAENRQFLFLFSSQKAAYVIDKNGFTEGSVSEFKSFMQQKTGLTFENGASLKTKILAAIRKK